MQHAGEKPKMTADGSVAENASYNITINRSKEASQSQVNTRGGQDHTAGASEKSEVDQLISSTMRQSV